MKSFYCGDIFLTSQTAKEIYCQIKDMPIFDYHCHLSPKEIYEDNVFENIGQMWLECDHYKWRLMRSVGIDEQYITGSKSYREKFLKYAEAIEGAIGNPLYHWTHMELKQFFSINEPLTLENAPEIWEKANKTIRENKLSPRKLIEMSNVSYIATTDDITDSLEYHEKLKQDENFNVTVSPSFRTDNLFLYKESGYLNYIEKLSAVSGVKIENLETLKEALKKRVEFFASMGCKMTDVGIERFPLSVGTCEEAQKVFESALRGENIEEKEFDKFISYIYVFLAGLYKKHGMIMQLHLAVKRNASSKLFETIGKDVGGDCVGEAFPIGALINLLDKMDREDALPATIVYTLNETMYYQMATCIRSFRDVCLGAAWWFCDNLSGIEKQLRIYSETASLNTFYGMLTDSRSFLSYARHDYFRRILASFIAQKVESGEFAPIENAVKIAKNVSGDNIRKKLGL